MAESAESLCGDYCLHSNRRFEDAAGMWSLYTGLTQAEDGFRCLKTDLGLRPVHNQTSERVRTHTSCVTSKRVSNRLVPRRALGRRSSGY